MTIEERIKILEDKVLKLEGGNLLKEEPTGNHKMISRPIKNV